MNFLYIIGILLSLALNMYLWSEYQSFVKKYNSLIDDFAKPPITPPITPPVQKQIYDLFKIALEKKRAQEKVRYMNHDFSITIIKQGD